MFEHADENGKVRVEDIVSYFIDFYEDRKKIITKTGSYHVIAIGGSL